MSMEQLTGGLDFRAIETHGSDAHPLALDWAGEFSKSNRGLFEAVEFFKNPAEFRNLFLTMAQEKQFKVAKFGYIDSDTVILAHTNEAEFRAFMADAKNEALKDRLVTVAVPYNVRVSDEEKIYRKLLTGYGARDDLHIAPYALRAAAMVAVLSRLKPHENLGLGREDEALRRRGGRRFKLAQIPEIKRAAEHEGMTGLGPRAIVDVLSGAATKAGEAHQTDKYLTPIMALIALTDYIERLEAPRETREQLRAFVIDARKEIDRRLKDEVRKAFVPAFAEHAQRLLENYLTNIEAYCQGTKTQDPITKEDRDPDEKLMRGDRGERQAGGPRVGQGHLPPGRADAHRDRAAPGRAAADARDRHRAGHRDRGVPVRPAQGHRAGDRLQEQPRPGTGQAAQRGADDPDRAARLHRAVGA